MQQFRRAYFLDIQGPNLAINYNSVYLRRAQTQEGLRIIFEITKDLFGYPNLGVITIYNMKRDRLTELASNIRDLYVQLSVGYGDNTELIFKGDVRNVINRRDGVDTITEIYAADGDRAYKNSYLTKTFEEGLSVRSVVEAMADSFGIPKDKLEGIFEGTLLKSRSFSGRTSDMLNKLSDEYGFYWSIQDGAFTTSQRETNGDTFDSIKINRNTGMIGSPAITEIGVKVKTLMNPKLKPYQIFQVQTPDAEIEINNLFFRKKLPTLGEGFYRVNKVTHTGDTRGNNWFSYVEGRRNVKLKNSVEQINFTEGETSVTE